MTEQTLIERLRDPCHGWPDICVSAANALEALEGEVVELNEEIRRLQNVQPPTPEATIWKFPADGPIRVPCGARWLSAQYQNGDLFAWAIVDPHAEAEMWILREYPTGGSAPDTGAVYIGTVQRPPYVWHVFAERTSW